MLVADALAELAQMARRSGPSARARGPGRPPRRSPRRVMAASASALHGPWARRPASTVRKPDMPGALRSVGNQPEPKLIAFSVRLKAARSSRLAPSRSGAGGDSAGSVAAYGSIASSTMRTCRARAATEPPRRGSRRSASLVFGADDHDRPARVVQQAGRDAAQHGGAQRRAAAAAGHDRRARRARRRGGSARRRTGPSSARRAALRRSRRRGPARRPRRPAPPRSSRAGLVECLGRLADHVAGQREQGGRSGALEGRPGGGDHGGTVPEHGAGALDRRLGVVGSVVGEQHGAFVHGPSISFARLAEPLGQPAGALLELVGQPRPAAHVQRPADAAVADPDHRRAVAERAPPTLQLLARQRAAAATARPARPRGRSPRPSRRPPWPRSPPPGRAGPPRAGRA